jgi:hypothetical protein
MGFARCTDLAGVKYDAQINIAIHIYALLTAAWKPAPGVTILFRSQFSLHHSELHKIRTFTQAP